MSDERFILHKQEKDAIRKAGRPSVNPFHQKAVEEDFYCRAQYVVEHYFKPAKEDDKKPFVLSDNCKMGKTTFWAFIFYLYKKPVIEPAEKTFCLLFPDLERPLLDDNLDHFLFLLRQKVGKEPVGDRGATIRVLQLLDSFMLGFKGYESYDNPDKGKNKIRDKEDHNKQKYRKIYQLVLRIWNEAASDPLA